MRTKKKTDTIYVIVKALTTFFCIIHVLKCDIVALDHIDFSAVKTDLKALFVDSKPWWPADYGTYAPFFVRLAWHCSGSYRSSDGTDVSVSA